MEEQDDLTGGDGNPSGPAVSQPMAVDPNQVFQMFQQLTANSQAATDAALRAVNSMQSFVVSAGSSRPESSTGRNEDVTKVLKQPGVFEHERRDDQAKYWPEWAFTMRLWLGYLDPEYIQELSSVEQAPESVPGLAAMSAEQKARALKLYAILATYIRGPALKIVRSVETHNGFAGWGALISHLEARSRQRALALLDGLTSFQFGKRTTTEGIYEFERLVREYELAAGGGTTFSEELKIAALLRNAPASVKTQLQLSLSPSTTYSGLRSVLLSFDKSSINWTAQSTVNSALGTDDGKHHHDDGGNRPMEMDRVYEKGKGKGKGKTKGKGKQKGPPVPLPEKGKGKGKGKQKGKGAPSNSSSSGTTCWICGKQGHTSKTCWQKDKSVRQIEQGDAHPGPSAQNQPGSSTGPVQTTAQTSVGNVRRIAVVDFTGTPANKTGACRVCSSGSARAVEYFDLTLRDDEDDWCFPDPFAPQFDFSYESVCSGDFWSIRPVQINQVFEEQSCEEAVDVTLDLLGPNGWVEVKERFLVGPVQQPILCLGKFLQNGWGLNPSHDNKLLLTNGEGASIDVAFKNNSLLAQAFVRALNTSPCIVRLSEVMDKLSVQSGWRVVETDDLWIPVFVAASTTRFQSGEPAYKPEIWPYRTTVIRQNEQWELIDCNMPYMSEVLPFGRLGARSVCSLTIFHQASLQWDLFFSEPSACPAMFQFLGFRNPDHPFPTLADFHDVPAEDEGVGKEQLDLGEDPANPLRAEASIQADLPVEAVRHAPPPQVDPPAKIKVGVELTLESSLKSLRTGCQFLGLGKSGSKAVCWKRLLDHLQNFESQLAADVSRELYELDHRVPTAVAISQRPDDALVELHELTHLPTEPWCETCMQTKCKEDRALSMPRIGDELRSFPTFQFDFAYTKCTDSSSIDVPVADQPHVTTFVGVDNWTRSCLVVPVEEKGKKSLKRLTQEICKFLGRLGYEEVCLKSDNEPSCKQLQESVIVTRARLGLKTLSMYNPPGPGHETANARVERMIQTVRRQAMCLRLTVEKNYKVKLDNHACIWPWCFQHASFLIQRFQVHRQVGMTAHEQVSGGPYVGKLCQFAEPVLFRVAAKKKGDIAWHKGIWLGKNEENDRHIVQVLGTPLCSLKCEVCLGTIEALSMMNPLSRVSPKVSLRRWFLVVMKS